MKRCKTADEYYASVDIRREDQQALPLIAAGIGLHDKYRR